MIALVELFIASSVEKTWAFIFGPRFELIKLVWGLTGGNMSIMLPFDFFNRRFRLSSCLVTSFGCPGCGSSRTSSRTMNSPSIDCKISSKGSSAALLTGSTAVLPSSSSEEIPTSICAISEAPSFLWLSDSSPPKGTSDDLMLGSVTSLGDPISSTKHTISCEMEAESETVSTHWFISSPNVWMTRSIGVLTKQWKSIKPKVQISVSGN